MKFDRLIALFPCESLEDFDLGRKEDDAEELLSAWSALWHPALLAGQDDIPSWLPPSTPPPDPSGCLVVVPDCCEPSLSTQWPAEAEAAGACLLRGMKHRDRMLAAALERLGPDAPAVDGDLAADFLALGYCHLQVELINRKSRYMSNLDESSFRVSALAAARAAVDGDSADARDQIQAAFDRLHEAREYFHPLEIRLLDLTLLAPTTLGAALLDRLPTCPTNLLVSGEVIDRMAQDEPRTLEALQKALEDGTVELIGGEYGEVPLPLLGPEAVNLNLARGLAAYEEHLGHRPVVFGRRRFGLTPVLPRILHRRGFTAAFHCTLDDGRFPVANQSRIKWEGFDSTTIDSLACVPLDAGRASSFLQLADKLGDAMDLDQTPTVVFAHWPGGSSRWYDDLRRIAAYSSVLGKFSTISAYFEQTSFAGQQARNNPDDYRAPYLVQEAAAGRRDPISRWVRYFARRAKLDAYQTLRTMETCVAGGRKQKGEEGGEKRENEQLALAIEDTRDGDESDGPPLDDRLDKLLDESLAGFTRSIAGDSDSTQRGILAVNPCSFRQRLRNVEVPAMGFAWIGGGDSSAAPPVAKEKKRRLLPRKKEPPLAEPNVLRNEFFEIRFDPQTGAIRSISDYRSRDPRLAQQIALRLPRGGRPGDETNYSIMAADRISVTSAGPVLGEIVCRGRLMDRDGRRLAGFKQTTRAWRGSRVIELLIELDVDRLPGPNPWDSYYAVRFAWKDETLCLYRSANMANVPTELTRIESPQFLDLRRDRLRTTLLCGGLPYHRRFGLRKLDTLLIVQGETARSFRLGIGIDVPHPTAAATGFLSPPLELPDQPPPPSPTGWLFHLDCRNVLATHWEPLTLHELLENDENSRGLTAPGGFRVRLLETDGCGVRLGLRCLRSVSSARILNVGDAPPDELSVEGDRIEVPIGPHQWIEVEARFLWDRLPTCPTCR
ncbi:MAG: hypothetical protein KKE86_12975 [Planctomycetes bacterium]|nr:hypothetical protein [Planctomycetota bacterium]MBU4400235.1 hypothetical protein [Planctomycetota bacterium]MCG2683774.1 hypothetical protein [Planctomycetales bacterium]